MVKHNDSLDELILMSTNQLAGPPVLDSHELSFGIDHELDDVSMMFPDAGHSLDDFGDPELVYLLPGDVNLHLLESQLGIGSLSQNHHYLTNLGVFPPNQPDHPLPPLRQSLPKKEVMKQGAISNSNPISTHAKLEEITTPVSISEAGKEQYNGDGIELNTHDMFEQLDHAQQTREQKRMSSSLAISRSPNSERRPHHYVQTHNGIVGKAREKSNDVPPVKQPLDMVDLSLDSSTAAPANNMQASRENEGDRPAARILEEVDSEDARKTAAAIDDQKPTRLRYSKGAAPSKYCHVCGRSAKTVSVALCGNNQLGLCRKVVCDKCLIMHQWGDFKAAKEAESSWTCTHCRGQCPPRARCHQYQRNNMRRRLKGGPAAEPSSCGAMNGNGPACERGMGSASTSRGPQLPYQSIVTGQQQQQQQENRHQQQQQIQQQYADQLQRQEQYILEHHQQRQQHTQQQDQLKHFISTPALVNYNGLTIEELSGGAEDNMTPTNIMGEPNGGDIFSNGSVSEQQKGGTLGSNVFNSFNFLR
jgi:hypothetical protein